MTTSRLPQQIVFGVTCLLLLFSPLMRAGNTAMALLIMQCMGLIMLATIGWWGLCRQRFTGAIWWFLLFALSILTLYLMPLPESLWRTLPGRDLYVQVYDWLDENGKADAYLALSVIPTNSLYSLLAVLPALAVFLAVGSMNKKHTLYSLYVFLGIAALQAAYGLSQYAAGFTDSATGSYPNRDHFSTLMEIAFPLAAGLTAYTIGRRHVQDDGHDLNHFIHKFNHALIFGSIALLLLLAGVFSRSRAGVALIILGLLLCSLLFARHIGGKRSAGMGVVISTIGFGIASSIGLIPVLNRFVQANPMEDERWRILEVSWQAVQQFFPFGTGLGTYADVYHAFQPVEQIGFAHNAHNDYLELLLETGVVGLGIILAVLALYAYGWWQMREQSWGQERFIKVGAGIGILLMLLHASVDFNFHIPANAVFFAFLAGLFLKRPLVEPNHRSRHNLQRP
ncbi:O-antigen ligase family protein [Thiothrix subterranea]|uniref:O-antigen ligase family protein n=1 Tax=Thiothrix subterranea TaxID=2735563 RepID=UPI00192C49C0|nr:O-antigen ligase family protein [Thiothrix subterranea]QQZ29896.1 O-antigen ligase family protein [Thiothrix subterranea]